MLQSYKTISNLTKTFKSSLLIRNGDDFKFQQNISRISRNSDQRMNHTKQLRLFSSEHNTKQMDIESKPKLSQQQQTKIKCCTII